MARFRSVDVYPNSGPLTHAWPSAFDGFDSGVNAMSRIARGVSERYAEGLDESALTHRYASLRIFARPASALEAAPSRDGIVVEFDDIRPDGFESASAYIPTGFAALPAPEQRRLALTMLHDAALAMANSRGLPVEEFEAARSHTEAHGYKFDWTSPWKAAPGRKRRARCLVELADDGFGRLRLEVADQDGKPIGITREQVAWTTREGFARAAKSLRWNSRDSLEVTPCIGFMQMFVGGTFALSIKEDDTGQHLLEAEDAAMPPLLLTPVAEI